MNKTLRILHIEDSASDLELTERHLLRAGYDLISHRVETPEDMRTAVENTDWDIIVCDYAMPNFSAPDALALLKQTGRDIPLIIISGSIGEDTAVAAMRAGAQDYLMKGRLARLAPTIERELQEAENRRARRQSEKEQAALGVQIESQRKRLDNIIGRITGVVWETSGEPNAAAQNVDFVSDHAVTMLGYSVEEWLALPNFWLTIIHPEEKEEIAKAVDAAFANAEGFTLEFRWIAKDGREVWVESRCGIIVDANGEPVGMRGVTIDVTEHKVAEARIKQALAAKEILLKETHHRLKNNLQIMSSLFNMQSEYVTDNRVLRMLNDCQNRIEAMSLIHEQLYQSNDMEGIHLQSYIGSLTEALQTSYGVDPAVITLNVNVENVFLDIDSAIPCGLIVNELVSNALKHAFPDGRKGQISIDLASIGDNSFTLSVNDNGIGMPSGFDVRNSPSLGLRLIIILSSQLGGDIKFQAETGTKITINFTPRKYGKRI